MLNIPPCHGAFAEDFHFSAMKSFVRPLWEKEKAKRWKRSCVCTLCHAETKVGQVRNSCFFWIIKIAKWQVYNWKEGEKNNCVYVYKSEVSVYTYCM
jgi:hypothetical protein